MALVLDKYDVFNALTVGAVHTAVDYLGVAGAAQPLNSRALAKAGMSAAADLAGAFVSYKTVPAPVTAPDAVEQRMMWTHLLVSSAGYPLLDMALKIDNRPMIMQFLVQAGSTFVGGKLYEPIATWAGVSSGGGAPAS